MNSIEALFAPGTIPANWMEFGSLEYRALDKLHQAWSDVGKRLLQLEFDTACRAGYTNQEDALDSAFQACYPFALEVDLRSDLDERIGYGLTMGIRALYDRFKRRGLEHE